ncbi:ABC transporter C family member 13 [Platanthera zijinensis]|uniref:ABC transporter C family member 13 n=1 Tax=Platanthera zijinensis TaxID=2320716 RepID=A0AAP0AWY7_9ASPA
MHGWEYIFTERLMERRVLEIQHLATRKYLDAWCVFFWATTPTLFSLSTFGVFTLMGHSLDAAVVFTSVALFNILISPLNSFPWVINGLIDGVISSRRLSKFFSCPEHSTDFGLTQISTTDPVCHVECLDSLECNLNVVSFRDVSSVWSSSDKEEHSPVMSSITLNLPKGLLIVVIGEVGSGKSSLLNSILGEMRLIHGCLHSCGSIAYVPQVPWIQSGSVRDNILFGGDFITRRYEEVLHACALDVDISRMAGGDLAFIGEKGLNLSGGQRARLALARAIYRNSDIYILDDILSAVDSHVANWVLQKALLGPLTNHKTRLLCTHNAQAIASAHLVVVMDKGNVRWTGTFHGFLSSPFSTISTVEDSKNPFLQTSERKSNSIASIEIKSYIEQEGDHIVSLDQTQVVAESEFRKEGRVEFDVYKSYVKFAGWPLVVLIGLSAIFMQASRNGNDLWLSHWVDSSSGTNSTTFYLVILSIFGVSNSVFTFIRAFSFSYGGLRAAVHVHLELLNKIVNAPVHFFDQNPSGRILNRFSSDIYMIDDSLPFILNILLANFLSLLGIVVVLFYAQIVVLLLIFPFWYIYSKLQFYYRSTSRELRRLDSISRSPIYSSFTETLDGSSTIRAFKSEEFFMAKFSEHVGLYLKTSYSETTASLWLSLRLQLLAAFIISFISLMSVIGNCGYLPFKLGAPGLAGLALSYAAPIVSLLSSFLTSFTETEKELISVERVLQYMDIPQEENCGFLSPRPDWPTHGQIEFEHVTLRYKPSVPAALNTVSFKINAGMQVGVVGRTGAGKSSIINALFRLAPICGGRILIDSLNVAEVSVRELRRSFAVVPQIPFLFEGSLRDNLDPSGRTSDEKMWDVLAKCHLRNVIESAGGLDILVKENGSSFSVGQCQLISLARALIKSSKILCLDECTANIDTKTASILQNTISNDCRGTTVITIAHRISVVLNMDYILVLDNGVLVEQGDPGALLRDSSSRFSGFTRASSM